MNFASILKNTIKAMRTLIRSLPTTAEQVEATNAVSWPIEQIVRLATEMDTRFPGATETAMAEEFEKQFNAFVADSNKEAVETAVAAAEAKYVGYVPKTELDAAVSAAAEAARKEGRADAMAEVAANAEAQTNRAKLIAAGLPEAAALKIPVAELTGANAEATQQKIAGRIASLKAFIPDIAEFASVCAEAGDDVFNGVLNAAKSAADSVKKPKLGNPMDGGGNPAADGEPKKRLRL